MNRQQQRAMFARINKNRIDNAVVDDVYLVVTNDGDFYRRTIHPNVLNIEKKMLRNDFRKDILLNKKSFLDRLGKEALHVYAKDNASPEWVKDVNIDTRLALGKELANKIMTNARESLRVKKFEKMGYYKH